MTRIIEKDLSYKIIGLCYKVHKKLGRFAREKQCADYLEEMFKDNSVLYEREYEIKNFQSSSPKGNRLDFFVERKIILDLKVKSFITKEDYLQMQRYLNAANLELGIIVNFRGYRLSYKRVLNSNFSGYSGVNSGN